MNELISVIVPIYNISEYIEKCVRSILAQTYNYIEIILVNDGSTDNSLEIIRGIEKEDQRISIIDKINGGLSSARNAGMRAAKGNYLLFVDGDDTIAPTAISILYENLMRERADISVMRVAQVFANGQTETFHFSDKEYDIVNFEEENWFFKDASVFHPAWNKLYRKDLIKFEFNEALNRNEDIEFNGKIYCIADKMVIINKPMYYQLQRSSSLCHSGRRTKDEIELVKILYDNIVDFMEETAVSEVRKAEIWKYLYFRVDILLQMIIYDDIGYQKRKEYIKLLKADFPGWKYSLVTNIKSYTKNKRFMFFKAMYDLHFYFVLYHFKDLADIKHRIRKREKVKLKEEGMFK